MPHQEYYPTRQGDQPTWLTNFAAKLALYGPTIPLAPAVVSAGIADALYLAYALGPWLGAVRDFAPGCTSAITMLQSGTSAVPYVLPVFTPPPLPAGVVPVLAGALTRIFALVQTIKNASGFNQPMGIDMGIVGATVTPSLSSNTLVLTAKVISGPTGDQASLSYVKGTNEGASVQSMRGTGTWEDIGVTTKNTLIDSRPLLVAGTPEVRQYRACFWNNGTPSGNWSAIVKVTISP